MGGGLWVSLVCGVFWGGGFMEGGFVGGGVGGRRVEEGWFIGW